MQECNLDKSPLRHFELHVWTRSFCVSTLRVSGIDIQKEEEAGHPIIPAEPTLTRQRFGDSVARHFNHTKT